MYKDKEKYLEYQRNYYKSKKQINKKTKNKMLLFEEQCIKKNIETEKRRNYYYNKRYDKLNPPIIKTKNELFLII